MADINRILVATDFSPASNTAVEYGCQLAAAFGSALHLLHVVTEPMHETWACYAPGRDFLRVVDELQSKARNELQRLVPSSLRQEKHAILATSWGDPSEEILKYAREHDIDLI